MYTMVRKMKESRKKKAVKIEKKDREADLRNLVEFSKKHKGNVVTIEGTVDMGFESVAQSDCAKRISCPESQLPVPILGRIYFNINAADYSFVPSLRSLNNISLVIDYFQDVPFSKLRPEETVEQSRQIEEDLQLIKELADRIDWRPYLDLWSRLCNFKGNMYPSRLGYEQQNENDENPILKYRVTCYRSGSNHSFGSQDAATAFGGRLQDMFHWNVDLSNYQLEIVIYIKDQRVLVQLSITESSLHRRNIIHLGTTTLRATIAYNLLQIAELEQKNDLLVVDPMCGSGSIPIEGAVSFRNTFQLCGDVTWKNVLLTATNKNAIPAESANRVDSVLWDVCRIPLRDNCVDLIATDMPFGKRIGSKRNNLNLYSSAMLELARIVRPLTGRLVLLTADRRSYNIGLSKNKQYWKQTKFLPIKMGGLKACVYLLCRTKHLFVPRDLKQKK